MSETLAATTESVAIAMRPTDQGPVERIHVEAWHSSADDEMHVKLRLPGGSEWVTKASSIEYALKWVREKWALDADPERAGFS
jgi:hypothetical protein